MRSSRLLLSFLLFTGCALLPNSWAGIQSRANAQEDKKDKKATDADTEKALDDLKKALEATQKDLAATNKTLASLKSATDADLKKATAKADALQKELDGLKASAKTALTKADLDAIAKKADAVTADVAALKAAGGDAKATTDKLAAIEKGRRS